MKNPLLDQEFLKQLDLNRNKELYAKINLLTFNEEPIKEIQGMITQGSINIDGTSSVRRTCSLSMVTDDPNINQTEWVLKNKFSLEVGVKNNINFNYPDIIWFKQGLFIFSSVSMSVQQSNYSISLQGKDKMCLLNGDLGGTIMASTDFGAIEEYETLANGEIIKNTIELSIIDIVKNMVHLYAGQPLEKIILNDVDEFGKELIKYRGSQPLWMLRKIDGTIANMIIDGEKIYYHLVGNTRQPYTLNQEIVIQDENNQNVTIYPIPDKQYFWNLADINNTNSDAWKFYKDLTDTTEYYIVEIENNETCGYRLTDLTYPGDLTAGVGESIVTVLDKIKNMFSDFEYFFDLDGRFIFQKKKTYINTSWNNIETSEDQIYVADAAYSSSIAYSFENGQLLSGFNNQPNISNIKNDFSIWGQRTSTSGEEKPVHIRYAINTKPQYYKPVRWEKDLDGNLKLEDGLPVLEDLPPYVTKEWILAHPTDETTVANTVDWREIIYQMAKDFYAFDYRISNFKQQLADSNYDYYPTGKTGYENYYMDLYSFWRDLYNPYLQEDYEKLKEKAEANLTGDKLAERIKKLEEEYEIKLDEYQYNSDDDRFWNINVSKYPENLNFWFDFLDTSDSELSSFSVNNIGNRSKGVKDDKIKAIYYKETPDVLFLSQEDYKNLVDNFDSYEDMAGYTFIKLTPQMENYFSISSQGKSAHDELDSLLYEHTHAATSVTLTTVPIYYLQPNVRIFIKDDDTKINGEYIVTKITVPLQYNGTSSITATKAVERIY